MRKLKCYWTEKTWCPISYHGFLDHSKLLEPKKIKEPKTFLINSNGDLFSKKISKKEILKVLSIAASANYHTFFFETKYPDRAQSIFKELPQIKNVWVGVSSSMKKIRKSIGNILLSSNPKKFIILHEGYFSDEIKRFDAVIDKTTTVEEIRALIRREEPSGQQF